MKRRESARDSRDKTRSERKVTEGLLLLVLSLLAMALFAKTEGATVVVGSVCSFLVKVGRCK